MQNQKTENTCNIVKETEEEIKRSAIEAKNEQNDFIGFLVKNMKRHILSNLCLIQRDQSIPIIKKCKHTGEKR